MRYTARGAVALERLGEDAHGDLMYTFTRPWSDGTTGITLSPLELLEKLAAIVPLPRVHLVRYAGCLAPHSQLRGAMIPTPRQQGVDGREASARTPRWSWARLLKRVFDLALSTCPLCRRGSLRIIAAITHEAVIRRILRHLKLAAVPPPIAPARARQETFDFDWVAEDVARGLVSGVQAAEVCFVGGRRLRALAIPCESVPPSVPRAAPLAAPLAVLPSPILRRLSSPRGAALGRPSPWPCALRRCCCAALGAREEP